MNSIQITVVIPAYNEADAIKQTVERLQSIATDREWSIEIIVVDDGSTDDTGDIARQCGARVLRNPVNGGYGLSLQRGIRSASHELVAITDADGTYPIEDLRYLVEMMDDGLDMAVGARKGKEYKKGFWKSPARVAFRMISEFVAGRKIPDINSGLRVMRRSTLLPYLSSTCSGFSFTTSITLILMLNGHFVAYRPIAYAKRVGKSKVRHFRDTLRTAQIITSIIAAHNPIKLAILVIGATTPLLIFTDAIFISWPIVFMLGCLGELIRIKGGIINNKS
jgi:glycosyltransferase involved in cell wall biosynthesis